LPGNACAIICQEGDIVFRKEQLPGRVFRRFISAAVALACTIAAMAAMAVPASAAARTFASIGITADGQGYAAISSSGQVYAYGTTPPASPAASSSIGQVYAYGTVRYWGNGDPGSSSAGDLRSRIAAMPSVRGPSPPAPRP
jgi:hypothetical protein